MQDETREIIQITEDDIANAPSQPAPQPVAQQTTAQPLPAAGVTAPTAPPAQESTSRIGLGKKILVALLVPFMPLLGITALIIRGCNKTRSRDTRLQWLQYLNTLLFASSVLTSIIIAIYLSQLNTDKNKTGGGGQAESPTTSQPLNPNTGTPQTNTHNPNQPQNTTPDPQTPPANGAAPSLTPPQPPDSSPLSSSFEEAEPLRAPPQKTQLQS